MFYKHWKKIALALTGFFWASCETETASANNVDEVPGSSETIEPNSSANPNSSASPSSSATTESSSQAEENSSSSFDMKAVPLYGIEYNKFVSSSSMEEVMPAYGVLNIITCVEDKAGRKYNGNFTNTILKCEDGVTCQETTHTNWSSEFECVEDVCPDYGVVAITEKTYVCDDGNTYNEAEFHIRYDRLAEAENLEQDSIIGEMQPALYGPPCMFNGTCDDEEK